METRFFKAPDQDRSDRSEESGGSLQRGSWWDVAPTVAIVGLVVILGILALQKTP